MTNTNKVLIEKCYTWMRHWGNGGGCYSLQNWVTETLETIEEECRDARNVITIDSLWSRLLEETPEYGCNSVYENLVNSMMDDLGGKK